MLEIDQVTVFFFLLGALDVASSLDLFFFFSRVPIRMSGSLEEALGSSTPAGFIKPCARGGGRISVPTLAGSNRDCLADLADGPSADFFTFGESTALRFRGAWSSTRDGGASSCSDCGAGISDSSGIAGGSLDVDDEPFYSTIW